MNRFSNKNKIMYYIKKIRLPILAFLILFIIFFDAIDSVNENTLIQQEEQLTQSLQRNITGCYAVEGAYPPSLEYIKEHYGLVYDENEFFVDYKYIGANIYPDITIILLNREP